MADIHLDEKIGAVAGMIVAAERVVVQLDQRTTKFINSKRHSFCEMLREKLHWRGDLKVDRATE